MAVIQTYLDNAIKSNISYGKSGDSINAVKLRNKDRYNGL